MSGSEIYRNSAEDKQRVEIGFKLWPSLPDEYRAEQFQVKVEWLTPDHQNASVSYPATGDLGRALRQFEHHELDMLVQEAHWAYKTLYAFVWDQWKVVRREAVAHLMPLPVS